MTRSRIVRAVMFAVLSGAAGCTLGGGQVDEVGPYERARTEQDVLLTVQNHDFLDATIYAYWNGAKSRVGTVGGKRSETFRMEWRGEYVRLGVEFIGSREGYVSELAGVTQGDHLDFVIMAGTSS
ncbi:MAG TPA: hypothetical protein VMM35_10170 [Longimicrobiales bacterium]|nr:hypothetical protein [Longimicrobiales bacterium]